MTDIRAKSQAAQRLKANTDLMDFVEEVRKDQHDLFANSEALDISVREEAHAILRALNSLENKLDAAIADEMFADKKLKG